MSTIPATTGTSSADIRADYLHLLVTQLQNQNPLEPMDNNQMASQLSQMAQLEQTESMNSSFSAVLKSQLQNQAVGLIGKTVTFFLAGEVDPQVATVNAVNFDGPEATVIAGNHQISMSDIVTVEN